jgi:hypothetical protein
MSKDETRPMPIYARQMHEEVEHYLERFSVVVAHGETGVLFGFIVSDPSDYVTTHRRTTLKGCVLYVYVAAPFRRRGIARRLFLAAGIDPMQRFGYVYRTQWSWDLRSKIPLAIHEPLRARYEEIEHVRRIVSPEGSTKGERQDPGPQDLGP